jgi:hypothetical protein
MSLHIVGRPINMIYAARGMGAISTHMMGGPTPARATPDQPPAIHMSQPWLSTFDTNPKKSDSG